MMRMFALWADHNFFHQSVFLSLTKPFESLIGHSWVLVINNISFIKSRKRIVVRNIPKDPCGWKIIRSTISYIFFSSLYDSIFVFEWNEKHVLMMMSSWCWMMYDYRLSAALAYNPLLQQQQQAAVIQQHRLLELALLQQQSALGLSAASQQAYSNGALSLSLLLMHLQKGFHQSPTCMSFLSHITFGVPNRVNIWELNMTTRGRPMRIFWSMSNGLVFNGL